jgi:PAS domain S-box-containing protein
MLPALRQPRGLLAPQPQARQTVLGGDPASFDALSLAVHVFTDRGTITSTNPAFDAMFGSPRARYVGRHQAALNGTSVETNLKLLEEMRAAVDSEGVWEGTLQNRRVDGMAFKTRAQVHPIQLDGRRCLVCFQEETYHGNHPST